jgi:hypothetical protein
MSKKKTLTLEQLEKAWEKLKDYKDSAEMLVPEKVAKIMNEKYPHKLTPTKVSEEQKGVHGI